MEVSKELFDQFIQWLKLDGLTPKKSERLWKKTILVHLLNGHKKTLDNWEDFMADLNQKQINQAQSLDFDENCLMGMGVNIDGIHKTIRNVVKCGIMSRIFFMDGSDVDVESSVPIKLLDEYKRSIK